MMHLRDDLFKGIITKPWIDTGLDHGNEIAQCL